MNPTVISGIVISSIGVLMIGMASIIKTMVVSRLDNLQLGMDYLKVEIHVLDLRITTLETEHRMKHCHDSELNGEVA